MKRGKPLRRTGPLRRRKGIRRVPEKPVGPPEGGGSGYSHNPEAQNGPNGSETPSRSGKRRTKKGPRRTPAVGTELSTFAVRLGCQFRNRAPGYSECWGPIDPHHVRPRGMGRARGDWVKLLDERIVGNVVGMCRGHHDWCGEHPRESRELLEPVAERIGEMAIERGITPRLHDERR